MRARRPWAWPVVPVYWAGLRVKDALRALGALPARRLEWPVVSVGSLSAGGAGKTPVVIALADLFTARSWAVDVLSRGYGRAGTGVERVDASAGNAATRFGDEPVLLAQSARVPVWVGADRFRVGTAAEKVGAGEEVEGPSPEFQKDDTQPSRARRRRVHLLDDGFQHRQLSRTVDIVLVAREDLDEALLPAGNRREPFAALRRADAIAVREEEFEQLVSRMRQMVRAEVPVWTVRRELVLPPELVASRKNCVAFCGIARPQGFFGMLRANGVSPAAEVAFSDHHMYTSRDMSQLVESCHLEGGGCFVTTEKDAVKIGPELRARLETAGPLHVARLNVGFVDPERVMRALEARLH